MIYAIQRPNKERCVHAALSWGDDPEGCCWSGKQRATASGLMALLLEVRAVYARMRGGRCSNCQHEEDNCLPHSAGGKCARCLVNAFVAAPTADYCQLVHDLLDAQRLRRPTGRGWFVCTLEEACGAIACALNTHAD